MSDNFITFDDPEYVTGNPRVAVGFSAAGIGWALTSFHAGNWHPLTWLSHMLDVTLFGLDARGHHATSILLHALNAGLLLVALARLTGSLSRSTFVAAIFGVHPLRVESVAWVAERKDLLAGLLFMLVLLAWERYARRGGAGRYLAALALFALGLMAKPMLVTLPFVLLLLDLWPLGRAPLPGGPRRAAVGWGRVLLEKLPFLALAAASSVVTMLAQRTAGALADVQQFPVGARLVNAAASCAAYLGATLWPARLAVYYPPSSLPWPAVAGALFLLALVTLAALRWLPTRPALAAGWFWFLGMLVPVSGLVQVGGQARADRYTYLPLIGVVLAATWLVAESPMRVLRRPRVIGPVAAGVVVVFAVASGVQAAYWRDSETLFRRTLAVTADNWVIEDNLAVWLLDQQRVPEAMAHAREAIRIFPGDRYGRNVLGLALVELGRHEEATALFREALRIMPAFPGALYNLGKSLSALGRPEEAIAEYRKAIQVRPDFALAHYNLGTTLAALGRHDEALASLHEALRIMPKYAEAHNNLGNVLAALGRHGDAIPSFREALTLKPALAEAQYNLGNSLAALERHEEAAASFRAALSLKPDMAEARYNLGNSLTVLGRYEEAIASLREAVRLRPGFSDARLNLGSVLASLGRNEEAISAFREALLHEPDLAEARAGIDALLSRSAGGRR